MERIGIWLVRRISFPDLARQRRVRLGGELHEGRPGQHQHFSRQQPLVLRSLGGRHRCDRPLPRGIDGSGQGGDGVLRGTGAIHLPRQSAQRRPDLYFPQGDDFWNPGITYTQNTASAYYKTGRGVGLQATALAGYHFVGWSGDVASTEEFLGLVADADKSLVANFEADPPPPTERQLVVNVVPAEGGTGTGGGTFPWSTTSRSVDVTLAAGFSFQYWEGYVSNSTSKYTTAYLPDAVNVVTAHLLNQTLDLSVIKSVDVSTVRVGESVTFTLGVERSGDYNGGIASHDFSNVKLVDTMPEGTTVTAVRVPAGGSYSLNGRVLSVTLPSVSTTVQPGYGFGGGARVEIDAVANTPGRKSNVVVLSAPEDSNDSNNNASVDINVTGGADAVDLVLDKAASPTSGVISGTTLPTFTYTVSAFNAGSGPASSVVITDTMAPGAQLGAVNNPFGTHTLNGNVLSLNLGNIAPNSGNYASYTVTYATPGQKKNVAVATFSGTDENPGDNTDSVTVQVTSSGSGDGLDFSIVIKPDAVTVSRDEPASYTATITLNGNQPSSAGASATITLPEGVTLVSSELGYGYYDGYYTNQATVTSAGNQVVISTGPMSGYNQSSKQYVPQVLVNFVAKSSVPGPHTIMGEVTASGDSYTANNRDDALLIVSGADLAVELDAQTPKGLGDNAQFTARVYALDLRYNGDDTDGDYFGSAYDSELTVTLPEYFNYTGCSVPPTSVNGKVLTWIIPVLAPQPWGAPGFSVDIRGTIDVDTPKEVQAITGHARISNPHPWENMNPNNDTDDATIDIIHPDWYVDIVPVDGFLKPGQTGTFNVTVGRTDDPYYGTVREPVTASVSITGDCASASGDLNFTLPAVTYPVTRTVSVVAANVMNGKIKAVATISPPPQDMVEENNQDSAEIAVGASGPSLYFPIYQRSATYSKYGRDAYKQRPGESEIPVFRKEEVIGAFKANGSWTDAGSTVGPTGNAPGPSINRWNNSGSFDRDWQDTGTTIWLAPMNGTSYAQTQYDYRVDRDSRNFFSSQYSFNDYYWLGAGWVHEVYDTTIQQKVTTTNGVTTVGWPPSWERWKGRTWAGRSDSWVNGCPHEWVHWYEDPSWYNATTTRGQWVHEVDTYTEEWLYGPTDNRFIKTASSLSQGILTNEYTTPQLVSDARSRLSSKPWGIEQMTTWGGAGTINSSVDITLDGKTCYMYEGKFKPRAYAPGLVGWTVRIKYHLQHYSRKDSNVGGTTRTVSSQHRREPSGTGNYEITATVGANGWAYFEERQIAPPVEDLQEQKGGNSASLQWVYDGIELTPP
ncbi:MAG: hypothetical protein E6Q40_15600 [Cupriavidus sp.]|nr:MAG: hypothetical protein E6Q40_15600 [Cupriavidus sp.]